MIIDDNIFSITYKANTYSGIDDFKEGYAAYVILSQGSPVKVLVEMEKHATISTEAREYAQQNKIPAIAEAIVLDSLPLRIIFRFYAQLRVQEHPLRIFKSTNRAITWLNSIK